MKRALFAAAGLLAIMSTPAFAQGWWNGFEVGVQGGYVWGTSKGDVVGPGTNVPYSFSPQGGIGGAHVGYNWQWDHIVLGLEGDAEGGSVTGRGVNLLAGGAAHDNMNFDASVRGKFGYAFDRILVYGTGGVAFGNVKTTYEFPIGAPITSSNGIRTGWTAGGGLAYALTPNWELGAEYRYTDLGHKGAACCGGFTDSNEFNYSAVRAVLTYRFAPPPPPPPMAAPMPAAAPAPAPAMARTFLVFFDFDKYNLTPDA
ncbi:MAG TPA: outer membrane protein, partial [Stellaceae bacterium]